MADRSQLGKILAEMDKKIAILQAARAEVLAAAVKRVPTRVRRKPEAVAEKEPAA